VTAIDAVIAIIMRHLRFLFLLRPAKPDTDKTEDLKKIFPVESSQERDLK